MSHQSDLIGTDINAYLAQHEQKELLRFLTCGNVDDGKSTLIGRLLHDSKMIYEDQLAAVTADSVKSGTTGGVDLALLVDGLQAEREQGITIDVAYRYFSTANRKFIIADTPGHEQYTRNMATGASTCDLAVILIDARHGVQTQTKRHSFIASLLGIKHIIVAINKMDLVEYSCDIFDNIKDDYLQFSSKLDLHDIKFIPMSALSGDNVVNLSEKMAWYKGIPFMEMLETIEIGNDRNFEDMRFPVQYVNRPNLNFRGFCGTLASGVVHKGEKIIALPSGKTSTVKSIVSYDGELQQAFPPMAITLTLEDEIDVSRGDMIVPSNNQPVVADRFQATIVWMSDDKMLPGKQFTLKFASNNATGSISKIDHRIDVNTLEHHSANELNLNEIALCTISVTAPVVFDAYQTNKGTGAFIIIDRLTNVTVAAGMISGEFSEHDDQTFHVTHEERGARFSQSPCTVWLTGNNNLDFGFRLERKLFDLGHAVAIIEVQELASTKQRAAILEQAGLISIAIVDNLEELNDDDIAFDSSSDSIPHIISTLRQKKIIV